MAEGDCFWPAWIGSVAQTPAATMTYSANDCIWYSWSADTGATASVQTWATWVTTAGTTDDVAWTYWINGQQINGTAVEVFGDYTPPELTAEQLAAIEADRRLAQERADQAAAERLEATARAKALLNSMLDEQQRAQLERDRFFEFVSQTGRRMRMKHGYSRNVDELGPDGKRVHTYCAHPGAYDIPTEDHMAAQLLALRYDEPAFMRVANVS